MSNGGEVMNMQRAAAHKQMLLGFLVSVLRSALFHRPTSICNSEMSFPTREIKTQKRLGTGETHVCIGEMF